MTGDFQDFQFQHHSRCSFPDVSIHVLFPICTWRCKPGEVEVKACTPYSNTVCQRRDPSPTKPSSAFSTPGPTSSPDLGELSLRSGPPASGSVTEPPTSADVHFYLLSVLPISLSLVIFILLILGGLAVWWFVIKRRRELPCECLDSLDICTVPLLQGTLSTKLSSLLSASNRLTEPQRVE